jgi:hypothetical protein
MKFQVFRALKRHIMIFGVMNLLILRLVIDVSVDDTAYNLRISSWRHYVYLKQWQLLYKYQPMKTYRDVGV